MKSLLPVILVGLGIALLALSFLWTILFPASRSWNEEKSARLTELQRKAHKLLYVADQAKTRPRLGGPTPTEAQANFDKAMEELDALKAEFEATRDSPKTSGTYLRYTGTALVLLGGFSVMMARGGG